MKTTLNLCLAGALLIFALGCHEQAADPVVLARDGRSLAPIVVSADALLFTQEAAEELADMIERISGARPPILSGEPDPLPPSAIWVGYQPALDNLFPDLDFRFQHPEEILIAVGGQHVAITGRDRWDPEHTTLTVSNWFDAQRRSRRLEQARQQEYGTANAVYTFMHDALGVRWLWPGELGLDVPERDTIEIAPFTHRFHPPFRGRSGILWRYRLDRSRPLPIRDWMRGQRMLLDSMAFPSGHAFADWWERFHESHPEYFALQPDGTRSLFRPTAPQWVKICKSNPAVWEQWMQDVESQLERDPLQFVFNASPNDHQFSGFCVCEDCRAWDHPDGTPMRLHWRGHREDYVALSDRQVTFANRLAQMLEARYPGRGYYVSLHAYGASRPPPVEAIPAPNVLITSVHNFMLREQNTEHRERFEAWGRAASALAWRPNIGHQATLRRGLPFFELEQTAEHFRLVADHGVLAFHFDTLPGHFLTQAPFYYLLAHLSWDPRQNHESILDDFYQRAFGPATEHVRAYWTMTEAARNRVTHEDVPLEQAFDAVFLDSAYDVLDRAEAAVETAPEIYRKRVDWVREGLDYTQLVIELLRLADPADRDGPADPATIDQMRKRWAEIEQIVRRHDETGLVGSRLLRNRLLALHPDRHAPETDPEDDPGE